MTRLQMAVFVAVLHLGGLYLIFKHDWKLGLGFLLYMIGKETGNRWNAMARAQRASRDGGDDDDDGDVSPQLN